MQGGRSYQRWLGPLTRWFRAHWRGILAGLLAGVGTPAGIIAGLASKQDRGWWLLGAGACAGLAALVSILPSRDPSQLALDSPRPERPSGNVYINRVLVDSSTSADSAEGTPRWSIAPPVQSFTGRGRLLLRIREQLTSGGTTALIPTTALYGLGGVGKTQLARAYAHRYRSEYSLGWWIPADSELSITTAFAELAVALGMSPELSLRELARGARELLTDRAGWLLIFDNASNPAETAGFIPAAGEGHVLLTSRSLAWQGIADPLPVDVLSLDDAVELLQKRSGDHNREAARDLAVELGQLALALEQAAAYAGEHLATYQSPLGRYLELFRDRHAELLAKGVPLAYSGTVDATFTLALDQLRNSNLPAVQLLEIFALLASDKIPVHLLLSRPERLPSPINDTARDPLKSDEMVSALIEAGLLTPDLDGSGVVRTHRIIQMAALARLSEAHRQQRIEQAVELLAALFPSEGWLPNWQPRCAELLPHARAIIAHANTEQLATVALAQLLRRVGSYFRGSRLALGEARDLHRQALVIIQRRHQGDHPDVARSLLALGADLRRLGSLREAQDLDSRALEMNRRLYKRDHPDLARSLGSLAADYRRLGDAQQAQALDTQALGMRRRLYQRDHPDLARSLFGLAMDLRPSDEVERARELDEETLEMRRRLYHGDHPAIAYSIGNLAVDLHVLGDFERAYELEVQALAMRRRLYHGDHPDIATNLTNLANALYMKGEVEQAQELDLEALAMRQRLYEGDHPTIAESLRNLAVDLRRLRQANRAKEVRTQEAAMYQRLTDAVHGDSGLSDIALFLLWTGRWVRAFDD